MVRISKLTDYALVIMAYIAAKTLQQSYYPVLAAKEIPILAAKKMPVLAAKEIAENTHLNLPTVSKLLKLLAKHKFLNSLRGIHGGYQLGIAPEQISIADLIQALEGPLAITECSLGHHYCVSEANCAIRNPWLKINEMISKTLSDLKLSDLVDKDHVSYITKARAPSNTLLFPTQIKLVEGQG